VHGGRQAGKHGVHAATDALGGAYTPSWLALPIRRTPKRAVWADPAFFLSAFGFWLFSISFFFILFAVFLILFVF
jgi:hypothetical protein